MGAALGSLGADSGSCLSPGPNSEEPLELQTTPRATSPRCPQGLGVPSPSDHPGWGCLAGAPQPPQREGPRSPRASLIPEPPPPPPSPAAHLGQPRSLQSRVWGETKGPAQLLAGDERKTLPRRLERVPGASERGCGGPFPAPPFQRDSGADSRCGHGPSGFQAPHGAPGMLHGLGGMRGRGTRREKFLQDEPGAGERLPGGCERQIFLISSQEILFRLKGV